MNTNYLYLYKFYFQLIRFNIIYKFEEEEVEKI